MTSLLLALDPAAPSNLNAIVVDLQQIGSVGGASNAVNQAVVELTAALRTASLRQLLTQVSGVSSSQNTSALSALADLQSLPLGGSAPAGSLAPVGSVLSALAGQSGIPASAANSLNSAAATTSELSGLAALPSLPCPRQPGARCRAQRMASAEARPSPVGAAVGDQRVAEAPAASRPRSTDS